MSLHHSFFSPFFSSVGISLLEVLVALMIFSLGALGLMGLQQRAIQSTESAYWHNQAITLARDMIQRIRANASERALYEQTDWQKTDASVEKSCSNSAKPCSPLELMQADKAEIIAQARRQLPAPKIQVQSCAGLTCVLIAWLDSSLSECNTTQAAGNHCVVMSFK